MSIGGLWLTIIVLVLLWRAAKGLARDDRSDQYRRQIDLF